MSTGSEREHHLHAQMVAYQAGRVEAFDALYAALAPEVRAYLVAACRDASRADDLVQETFLRLHRARATYQPGLPVRPWVRGIARRVYLMDRRAAARRGRREDAVVAEARSVPAGSLGRGGERPGLERALAGVPASARQPFLLHHLFGFTFAEIAARLGIEVGAAKVRSSRARVRLRALLGGGADGR
ncbi:MAG: RNA polymerase sigma factor [Vicinamibacteraceae bacterium]